MDKRKFEALLSLIVPQITALIVQHDNCTEVEAIKQLYNSYLYECLEDEKTKLWHLSPQALFCLYEEEKSTGVITFPEG